MLAAEAGDDAAARVSERSDEGSLHWIPAEELLGLNLWPGDRHFIPLVSARQAFMGTIWYRGQDVERYWVRAL